MMEFAEFELAMSVKFNSCKQIEEPSNFVAYTIQSMRKSIKSNLTTSMLVSGCCVLPQCIHVRMGY